MDLVHEPRENAIHEGVELTALHLLGNARIAGEIAEQDRDVGILSLDVGACRIGIDLLGHLRRGKLVHIVAIAAQAGAPDR